jgi:hypothetical protein
MHILLILEEGEDRHMNNRQMNSMDARRRFDGTAARQLVLEDDRHAPLLEGERPETRPSLRLLQKDVYAELARRRRRAQMAARHLVDAHSTR